MLLDVSGFRRRAQLTELMDEPCSRSEMEACLKDIAKLNRLFLAYRPTLHWLESLNLQNREERICILDVGCGYGDGLRRVARWAKQHGIAVKLLGLDLNPDAISIAAEATGGEFEIEWIAADLFAFVPDNPVHIVMSSQFTHHLCEADIVRFLAWMERQSGIGWFVNDLSRSATPYYLLCAFARIAGLHRFVRHDGPVSIARAFVLEDWQRMCDAAGLKSTDISIKSYRPARLCVERKRPR